MKQNMSWIFVFLLSFSNFTFAVQDEPLGGLVDTSVDCEGDDEEISEEDSAEFRVETGESTSKGTESTKKSGAPDQPMMDRCGCLHYKDKCTNQVKTIFCRCCFSPWCAPCRLLAAAGIYCADCISCGAIHRWVLGEDADSSDQ